MTTTRTLALAAACAAVPGTALAQSLADIAVDSLLANPRLVIPGRVDAPGAVSVQSDFTQGVPGDDYEFSAFYRTPLITGERAGYDVLNAVDPSADLPGEGLVVSAYGSVNNLLEDRPGDLFVVGDHMRPYYLSGSVGGGTDSDFMRVYGLEAGSSTVERNTRVQLHGTAADYTVVPVQTEFETGSAVFYTGGGGADMVVYIDQRELTSMAAPIFSFVDADDAPDPTPRYAGTGFEQFGNAAANAITDAEITADGDLVVTGVTRADLDGASGSGKLFAARFGRDGQQQWMTQFGSADGTLDAAVDSAVGTDGYYVTGRYLGDGPIGQKDAYTVKLDLATGAVAEEALFGGPGTQFGGGAATAIEGGVEYVYTSGIGREIDNPDQADQDPYVEKRRADDLSLVWRTTYGGDPVTGGTNKEPWGQLATHDGMVYSSGWVLGEFDAPETGNAPPRDVWLSQVNADGEVQWVEQWGSPNRETEWAWGTAADDDGFIYVVGHTYGDLGGVGAQLGEGDGFVSKIDPDAADGERVMWTVHVGTDQADEVRNIEIRDGVIYLSGHTWGSLDGTDNAGLTDIFAAKLDLDGNLLDAAQFGTPGHDRAFLAVGEDVVYLAGFTEGSMTGSHAGFVDAYVLPLDMNLNLIPEPAAFAALLPAVTLLRRRRG